MVGDVFTYDYPKLLHFFKGNEFGKFYQSLIVSEKNYSLLINCQRLIELSSYPNSSQRYTLVFMQCGLEDREIKGEKCFRRGYSLNWEGSNEQQFSEDSLSAKAQRNEKLTDRKYCT